MNNEQPNFVGSYRALKLHVRLFPAFIVHKIVGPGAPQYRRSLVPVFGLEDFGFVDERAVIAEDAFVRGVQY